MIDLDKLGKAIDLFAKTEFRAVAGGDDGDGYDEIEAVSDGGDRHAFSEVFSDDCAAPLVEILTATPELLRLARVGQAISKARSGYYNSLSVPCDLCHAPVGAPCVDVPTFITRLNVRGDHPFRVTDAMRASDEAVMKIARAVQP